MSTQNSSNIIFVRNTKKELSAYIKDEHIAAA
jgi:hypothetical protein